jgi:cytochrome c oxidase assembly factor CtaG
MLRPVEPALRRVLDGPFGSAPAVVAIYAGSLMLWHVPPLYDLALENGAVHFVQHASLLLAGAVFWWRELAPERYRKTGGIGVVFYVAAGKLLTGLVASLLAFGPVLYDFYAEQGRVAGLSVAEDQQLGGLLMILVDSTFFIIAFVVLFYRALGESDRDDPEPSTGAHADGAR